MSGDASWTTSTRRVGDPVGWAVPLHHSHLERTGAGPPPDGRCAAASCARARRLADGLAAAARFAHLGADADRRPSASTFEPRGPASRDPSRVCRREAARWSCRVDEAPPTTLCVEVRDGRLHVFLPPLEQLEHAVELLAAVEAAAAELATPVVLEGYPLPRDPRLREVVVGPDPGVIEVNVQPAASWPELVEIVTTVYGEARRVPAWRPRNSSSTAATPAPAGATT